MKIAKVITIKVDLIKIILAIQLAVFGLIGLEYMRIIDVPILRPVICFIYLIFVPGILILGILKLDRLCITEIVLYSVGLSLSFLMFIGALINYIYPLLGILKPISTLPLLVTISIGIFLMCYYIYYSYGKHYTISISIDRALLISTTIFLLLFPFLAVFGVYLLNVNDNNMLLLIQLVIISIIPILVVFDKLPEKTYPLAIWGIAISLLFQNSLPSDYPRFTDNFFEYKLADLVIKNGSWDPTIPALLNAMLGVVILLPMFSIICKISLVYVFKIIVSILYSLVPLGLYYVYKSQTSSKIAFFSCLYFISLYEFFTWAGLTMKQVTAGLFFMLILLLITNERIKKSNKLILSIIFAFSLAVSHYGTSYIFMFCSLIVLGLVPLLKKIHGNNDKNDELVRVITPTFFVIYVAFIFIWYTCMSKGSAFNNIVGIGKHIIESILALYILPPGSYASKVLFEKWSISLEILKTLTLISTFLIIIGLLNLFIYNYYKNIFKFNIEYVSLSIALIGVGVSVFIGYSSGFATPDRIFHLMTFCTSPFCIIGGLTFIRTLLILIYKIFKLNNLSLLFNLNYKLKYNNWNRPIFLAISIFLIIYFLVNTGFVSEVIFKDFPGASIYISKPRIEKYGTIQEKEYLHRTYIPTCDILSGKWLQRYENKIAKIYSDYGGHHILGLVIYSTEMNIGERILKLEKNKNNIKIKGYIYIRKFNNDNKAFVIYPFPKLEFLFFSDIASILNIKNKIYSSSNGSEILYG